MKILFCRYRNIAEEDAILSMKYMGHDVDTFEKERTSNDYDIEYMEELKELLLDNKFDCVFSINFTPIISRVCDVFKIKYISWGVDAPWYQLNSITLKNECNYVFLFDKSQYERYKHVYPERIHHMPLGSNCRFFDAFVLTDEEKEEYNSDVSFVGSLYENMQIYDKVRDKIPDYIKGYIEAGMKAQENIYGYYIIEDIIDEKMADEFIGVVGWNAPEDYEVSNKEILVNEFIGKKCSELERKAMVSKLAKNFDFKLFTTSDTSEYPYIKNMGPVDSRYQMPKVFKASKININTTITTIKTGIPLRIFDIMACGGFVISNYQSELFECFVPGEDLAVFESMDDLVNKVSYYLEHEEERKRIALNGYNKVKKMYTTEHRLKEIFSIVWGDAMHSYGVDEKEYIEDGIVLMNLLENIEMKNLLDVGLFLGKAKKLGVEHKYKGAAVVDGLEVINTLKDVENIYENVYNVTELNGKIYDLAIMYGILRYLNTNEMVELLKEVSKVVCTIITDYKEDYILGLKESTKYSVQPLDAFGKKLLLINLVE